MWFGIVDRPFCSLSDKFGHFEEANTALANTTNTRRLGTQSSLSPLLLFFRQILVLRRACRTRRFRVFIIHVCGCRWLNGVNG